ENKNKVFKPTMKTLDLVLFGIAAIVGSGVMVLTGVASASAGPAVIFSFLLAGLACTIVALCYAEMASAVPSSGSTYTYMYVALG
ncbi:amino acid permease, partial [Streptococcus danieliae]|nr:amino acid permease [Streptococcus danieliae]